MDIGKKLKHARITSGLTQEELASKLAVSRQTISNWENERSYPDVLNIIELSTIFDISLDTLLKQDQKIIKHIEENTNVVKSNKKLFTAIISNSILLILFILFSGFIPYNSYFILGIVLIFVLSSLMLFYRIIQKF